MGDRLEHPRADQGTRVSRARRARDEPRRDGGRDDRLHRGLPGRNRRVPRRGRRPGRRAGRAVPHRRHPAALRRQPAPGRGRHHRVPSRRVGLPAAGADAVRGDRAHELFPVHLRARRDERGDYRPRHARRPGRRAALVGVADRAGAGAQSPDPDGRTGRARGRARLRRRVVTPPAQLHSALPVPERPRGGRVDHQLADVGSAPGAVHQRDDPRREDQEPRPEQRRLRPRVLPRRADREVHVRHRRRLHRPQVGPERGRAPAPRADRERHHPRLRHDRRPRRRHHRQRDFRRRAQHLRGEVPHGQPAARSRAPIQEQRRARRRDRAGRRARRDRRRGGRGDRRGGLLLRGGEERRVQARPARRGSAERHEPEEQVRLPAARLRRLADHEHPRAGLPVRRRAGGRRPGRGPRSPPHERDGQRQAPRRTAPPSRTVVTSPVSRTLRIQAAGPHRLRRWRGQDEGAAPCPAP